MLLAAHRLAFHFHRPVSELNLSLSQFFSWLAYLQIEPPDEGDNTRMAALMAQITNMSGKTLPKGKSVSLDDFLGRKKMQTADEQKTFMKSLTRNQNGR